MRDDQGELLELGIGDAQLGVGEGQLVRFGDDGGLGHEARANLPAELDLQVAAGCGVRDDQQILVLQGIERQRQARAGAGGGDQRDIREAQHLVGIVAQRGEVVLESEHGRKGVDQRDAERDKIGERAEAAPHDQGVIDPYHAEGAARRQQVAGAQALAHGVLAFKVRGGEPRLLLRGRHS